MVTHATAADLPNLIEIWEKVYGDERVYIDSFLSTFFKEEYTWCYRVGGRIVSLIYGIPAHIWTTDQVGERRNILYLYAGATHPAHRKKGYYSKVLKEAIKEYGLEAEIVLVPVPNAIGLYEEIGFSMICRKPKESYQIAEGIEVDRFRIKESKLQEIQFQELNGLEYKQLRDRQLGREGYVEWSQAYMDYIVKTTKESKGLVGKILLGERAYLMLALIFERKILVLETTLLEEDKSQVATWLSKNYGSNLLREVVYKESVVMCNQDSYLNKATFPKETFYLRLVMED